MSRSGSFTKWCLWRTDLVDPIRGIVLEVAGPAVRGYDHVMFSLAYLRTTIEHLVAELAA